MEKWTNLSVGWRISTSATGAITASSLTTAGAASGTAATTAAGALTVGKWTHIVLTFDGTANPNGLKLYVANAGSALGTVTAVNGTSAAANINSATTTHRISSSTASTGFLGTIGDVRLYSVVLAAGASSVIANLHDDAGNMNGAYANNGEANLLGAWRMDEARTADAACPPPPGTAVGTNGILCDVRGEAAPLAAAGSVNNIAAASFAGFTLSSGSWVGGIVPLGLTWNNPLVNPHSYVTYGPQ